MDNQNTADQFHCHIPSQPLESKKIHHPYYNNETEQESPSYDNDGDDNKVTQSSSSKTSHFDNKETALQGLPSSLVDVGKEQKSFMAVAMPEDSARERLKRHRVEVAGQVWIPDIWGQEELLKDWIDCSAFDASLVPNGIMSARAALVDEGRRANSSGLRIENRSRSFNSANPNSG
ncbi:hypothetical protein CMV_017117 [Castanea mollissima]|uniref:Protein BIC1 n=1 Tax=Castanea mollissima TaxID=60419 RepID=A0A8J4R6R6_9ROSI|nr:hypothetical protein CMV_017117 [Castanea mollissima]